MNDNSIILEDLHNKNFNFKKFLGKNNHIIWKNCSNLDLDIDNNVNKIEFKGCSNIKLNCHKITNSLILEKSEIKINPNDIITNIKLKNSKIIIKNNKKFIKNITKNDN